MSDRVFLPGEVVGNRFLYQVGGGGRVFLQGRETAGGRVFLLGEVGGDRVFLPGEMEVVVYFYKDVRRQVAVYFY